jgi:NAD(P)-dependent dehydrogenase (short-subunit alcohol dehydrogenase family)
MDQSENASINLNGRTAIVTGAAAGIGAATAILLAERGATVALVDRHAEGLAETAQAISASKASGASRDPVIVECDVTDASAAQQTVQSLHTTTGRIDILATCAGVSTGGGTVLTLDNAAWDRVWQINVMGTVHWVKAALPAMIANGRGSIITVASQLAFNSGGNNCAYIATKGAIVAFTKTTAVDFAKDGIRVNTVAPGVIDTAMSRASAASAPDPEAMRKWRLARHPVGRIGTAVEVARTIAFLASDEAAFTTGTVAFVDGGWTSA